MKASRNFQKAARSSYGLRSDPDSFVSPLKSPNFSGIKWRYPGLYRCKICSKNRFPDKFTSMAVSSNSPWQNVFSYQEKKWSNLYIILHIQVKQFFLLPQEKIDDNNRKFLDMHNNFTTKIWKLTNRYIIITNKVEPKRIKVDLEK